MALPSLLDALESLPAFTRVAGSIPAPGGRISVGGLAGSSDAVLLAALARRFPTRFFVLLADGIPGAELVVVEDAGHMLHLEQPEAFAGAVEAFLAR